MKISDRPEFKSKKPPLTFTENETVLKAVKAMKAAVVCKFAMNSAAKRKLTAKNIETLQQQLNVKEGSAALKKAKKNMTKQILLLST